MEFMKKEAKNKGILRNFSRDAIYPGFCISGVRLDFVTNKELITKCELRFDFNGLMQGIAFGGNLR